MVGKYKIKKEDKAAILMAVHHVLKTGDMWLEKDRHYPVGPLVKLLLSIPGMILRKVEDEQYGIHGFATNGWQWDWWQEFDYRGNNYTLHGSGYYGGVSFEPSED